MQTKRIFIDLPVDCSAWMELSVPVELDVNTLSLEPNGKDGVVYIKDESGNVVQTVSMSETTTDTDIFYEDASIDDYIY